MNESRRTVLDSKVQAASTRVVGGDAKVRSRMHNKLLARGIPGHLSTVTQKTSNKQALTRIITKLKAHGVRVSPRTTAAKQSRGRLQELTYGVGWNEMGTIQGVYGCEQGPPCDCDCTKVYNLFPPNGPRLPQCPQCYTGDDEEEEPDIEVPPGMCYVPRVDHATLSSGLDLVMEGDTVQITCDKGYQISDPAASAPVCGGNGLFSPRVPSCDLIACDALSNFLHGFVSDANPIPVGSSVSITCEYGFAPSDPSATDPVCALGTGGAPTFIPPPSTCDQIMCPALPTIANGAVSDSNPVPLGGTVDITCNSGFAPASDAAATVTCSQQPDGTAAFNPTPTACVSSVLKCAALPPVTYGSLSNPGAVEVGAQVTVDTGYEPVDAAAVTLTCNDNGGSPSFSPATPTTCQQIACTPLSPPANGAVSDPGSIPWGGTTTITCNEGYRPTVPSAATVTCAGGLGATPSFAPTPTECEQITCTAVTAPSFATVSSTAPVPLGGSVTITCDAGYEPAVPSAATVTCYVGAGDTSIISPTPTTCIEIMCPAYTALRKARCRRRALWPWALSSPSAAASATSQWPAPLSDKAYTPSPAATCTPIAFITGPVAPPTEDPVIADVTQPTYETGNLDPVVPDIIDIPAPAPAKDDTVPPNDAYILDGSGVSLLNSPCATWRDQRTSKSVTEQKRILAKCMAMDCQQSMRDPTTPTGGCRFLDANGLCYAYNAAQVWCASNTNNVYCNDGGADWALPPIGTSAGDQYSTSWMPKSGAVLENPGAGDAATYDCACMKSCTCQATKCWCVSTSTTKVGTDTGIDGATGTIYSSSSKKGQCTCSCGGVMGI
eukprot:CAMPEP_0181300898 /NCGR_PEP_ID=MMETSP1101-20121128/7136_1 /TAXON_ID=46948 /ORGANISM="Rhodomonas abbreviata, Strain Caron Lab Isolate" /LENGTH=835 /DNA_ID=CAMNT_0023406167 /DNA_START=13 /DNA_END=2522 /DNA_ORIENTATION=-